LKAKLESRLSYFSFKALSTRLSTPLNLHHPTMGTTKEMTSRPMTTLENTSLEGRKMELKIKTKKT
jgi:hypothetical protein